MNNPIFHMNRRHPTAKKRSISIPTTLSWLLLASPSATLAGELEVNAETAYSTTLPWSPTTLTMFDLSKTFNTIPVVSGGSRPTLESPAKSELHIGKDFITSAWASASPGVLKTRAIIEGNPVAIGSSPSFFGSAVYSGAFFGDSLTYSQGGQEISASRSASLFRTYFLRHL